MSKEFDYTKLKHVTSVDQSDRKVPYNLRQSGPTKVEMLISTRVRKSPYWHLSMQAGCWRATVYNRIYHPRGYVKPEDGGAMVEYDAIVNHVTMWNVAVERQIQVKGPDAEKFVDYVITRDATKISPMRARYVILCNYKGGVLDVPNKSKDIDHIISIVGWEYDPIIKKQYWIVRNSWGEYWGELGYIRVVLGENQLGLESDCAWAIPGSWSKINKACDENGENC